MCMFQVEHLMHINTIVLSIFNHFNDCIEKWKMRKQMSETIAVFCWRSSARSFSSSSAAFWGALSLESAPASIALFRSFHTSCRRKNVLKYSAKYDIDMFSSKIRSMATFDALVGNGASWINLFSIGNDSAMQTMQRRIAKLTISQSERLHIRNQRIQTQRYYHVYCSPDTQSWRLSKKLTEKGLPLWFTSVVTAFWNTETMNTLLEM